MAKGEWQDINPAERSRTYHYATGDAVRYHGVSRVKVSESGNHYIEAASASDAANPNSGKVRLAVKDIVAPGWQRIELDIDAWTF